MWFSSTKSDPSLFTHFQNLSTLFILTYVDDIIATNSSTCEITSLISSLHNVFALKDLDFVHCFLGIETTWISFDHLHLSQTKYIKEILQCANIHEGKAQPTPMITSLRLTQYGSTSFEDPTLCWSIVGTLQYVTITRPELNFSLNKVCQYASIEGTSLESTETNSSLSC